MFHDSQWLAFLSMGYNPNPCPTIKGRYLSDLQPGKHPKA